MRLLKFSGEFCPPCKQLDPILDKWAASHPEIKIVRIDVETPEGDALSTKQDVRAVPTCLLFSDNEPNDGEALAELVGLATPADLEEFLKDAIQEELERQPEIATTIVAQWGTPQATKPAGKPVGKAARKGGARHGKAK